MKNRVSADPFAQNINTDIMNPPPPATEQNIDKLLTESNQNRTPKIILEPGQETLYKLSPVQFDIITSVIDIYKDSEIINIQDSIVGQELSSIYAISDITDHLNGLKFSMSIPGPTKMLGRLRVMIGNKLDVVVIKDDSNKRFIFKNETLQSSIPYINDSETFEAPIEPDEYDIVGEPVVISKLYGETIRTWYNLVDDHTEVYLLLDKTMQLCGIQYHTNNVLLFPDFANPPICYDTAAYRLNVGKLLPIIGEEGYTLKIAKSKYKPKDADNFWLITECETKYSIHTHLIDNVGVTNQDNQDNILT